MAARGYIDLKYKPNKSDLVCSFRVEPASGFSLQQVAEMIAGESSIGTWTAVATMSPRIRKIGAKVFELGKRWIKVAYPAELFEPGNMPQILSSVGGNIFGMKAIKKLRLEDIKWPLSLIRSFKGPRYGIPGIRKLLRIPKRPLTGTIIKPKLGLSEKEHAAVAYEAWSGGIDIVKDDENLSNQRFNRFEGRVKATLRKRDRAERETGERKVYMPNITAETNEMLRRADMVKRCGGEYVMLDILTAGWSALQTLREFNDDLNLVLHGHRAGHAAFTRGEHGISMLVVADIARLIGVDQLHIGTVVGKMAGEKEEVVHIGEEIEQRFVKAKAAAHTLAEDWHGIRPVFAVCSGGIHPGLVPRLIRLLGSDIIIQSGGGVHGHPAGSLAGATAMRQAVEATLQNISLSEYAKSARELQEAIKQWGAAQTEEAAA